MVIIWLMMVNNDLVGGWAYPKNDGLRQLGWWLFPTEWKVIKLMFQTTKQIRFNLKENNHSIKMKNQ